MNVYLRAKFQVSSVTLTSFRQGGVILPPYPPPQNKTLKSSPGLGLRPRDRPLLLHILTVFLFC